MTKNIKIIQRKENIDLCCYFPEAKHKKNITINPNGQLIVPNTKIEWANLVCNLYGNFTTKGLIDIQVKGIWDSNFCLSEHTPQEIDNFLAKISLTGVTKCLLTLELDPQLQIFEKCSLLDSKIKESKLGPYMVAGYYLKFPYLKEKYYFHSNVTSSSTSENIVNTIFDIRQILINPPILLVGLPSNIYGVKDIIQKFIPLGIEFSVDYSISSQRISDIVSYARLATNFKNFFQFFGSHGFPYLQFTNNELISLIISNSNSNTESDRKMIINNLLKLVILTTNIDFTNKNDEKTQGPINNGVICDSIKMDQMLRILVGKNICSIPDFLEFAYSNPIKALVSDRLKDIQGISVVEWKFCSNGHYVHQAHIGPYSVYLE